MSRSLLPLLSILVALSLFAAACSREQSAPVGEPADAPSAERPAGTAEEAGDVPAVPDQIPEGGFVTHSTFADASTLNPILASDSSSFDVISKVYLGLVTTDPFTGETVPDAAESWRISEDGLVYTFTLRADIVWSDGTPFTAADVKYTFDAVASEAVESPRKDNVALVERITAVDDATLEVAFSEVDCTALTNLGLAVLPSHLYAADYSDIMESEENKHPTVASGPFGFQEWLPDDHVTVVRNERYFKGAPHLDGWTYRVFADQSAELAALFAGEVDVTSVSPQFVSQVEEEIAGGAPLAIRKYLDDGYTYVGFNLANPANPQPGWEDLDGNGAYDEGEPPLPQDPHPVLSDINVRRAIAQAIDYTNLIDKVVFGQGEQTTANVLPAVEWAFNADLEPYPFDPEAAAAILDQAEWIDADGDGVRERDGQPLALTVTTNAGNEVRENIAAILQDNLNALGFDIELDIIEFGTMVDKMLGQTYDMVIIGWTGLGSDPDDSSFWRYQYDDPGAGFNFVSFYDETVEENLRVARSLPGCAQADRGPLYKEAQRIIHDQIPYAFLYVPLGNVVWNTRLHQVDPGPWDTYHNVEQWYATP